MTPQDGRIHLLPEEFDDHTKIARRMVFVYADFHAVFGKRKDHAEAGLGYTVQFSADLGIWVDMPRPHGPTA